MSQLAVSPDNYAARSDAVAKAGVVVSTLNDLSTQVQALRRETEAQMASRVEDLNRMLSSLEQLNNRIGDLGLDTASRAALFDQRDRLVSEISTIVDIRADYRIDGTVALMTRSGVGLLDGRASTFEFESVGSLTASSQFSFNQAENQVGRLLLRTPAGLTIDLVQQNVLKSGELGALVELRDKTLVLAQEQLDDVAAALAQAMSTVETAGTPATSGAASGYAIDLSAIRNGNDFKLTYMQGGVERSVRVVRVDDASKLPMDTVDSDGNRVIGMDFSGGAAAMAPQLQALLGPGFAVSATVGGELQILDDGAGDTTDVLGLSTRTTVTGTQGAGLALSLFVDSNNADFTNALDGIGQKRGFAARIAINADVLSDPTLMVQFAPGASLAEDDRAQYLLDRLDNMRFATYDPAGKTKYRLAGSVGDLINQTMDYQGNVAAVAINEAETRGLTLQTLVNRMDAENGVDIDEEMARLMELQNAYAANARVLSTVQELLEQLMAI